MIKALERCEHWIQDVSFPTVTDWKQQNPNGKVVGFFPVYAPLEIIHAAGMLPLAVMGAGNRIDLEEADAMFPSFVCSIPRTSLQLTLNENIKPDVMLFSPICDVARNLLQIWRRKFPTMVSTIVHFPHNLVSKGTVDFIYAEYRRLIKLLEEISGNAVTHEALVNSIELYNQQRQRVRRIYQIRQEEPWLISAAEAYALVQVGTMMPVEAHISILDEVLAALPLREKETTEKIKVMWEGGFCEQPPLEMLQRLDKVCYIVNDDFGLAQRWYTADIPNDADPLRAFAQSYRDLFSYASIQHDDRWPKWKPFLEKVKRSGAQAVILCAPKFCEPGLDDQVSFADALATEKIPYLSLDFQENMISYDSLIMQVETFVEAQMLFQ
ncbi:2-hydroxyacyl-CoA dehydratase [Thermodesulfobacteriota bacterium]